MKRKLYRVTLPDSGEIVIIRPLSPIARRELILKAESLYPLPDEKAFEKPAPNPLVAGQMIPGSENPEYQALLVRALNQRKSWIDVMVVESGVILRVNGESREATITRLSMQVDNLHRKLNADGDVWLSTVKYGLISTRRDAQTVIDAAYDPLTEGEVKDAMVVFRSDEV